MAPHSKQEFSLLIESSAAFPDRWEGVIEFCTLLSADAESADNALEAISSAVESQDTTICASGLRFLEEAIKGFYDSKGKGSVGGRALPLQHIMSLLGEDHWIARLTQVVDHHCPSSPILTTQLHRCLTNWAPHLPSKPQQQAVLTLAHSLQELQTNSHTDSRPHNSTSHPVSLPSSSGSHCNHPDMSLATASHHAASTDQSYPTQGDVYPNGLDPNQALIYQLQQQSEDEALARQLSLQEAQLAAAAPGLDEGDELQRALQLSRLTMPHHHHQHPSHPSHHHHQQQQQQQEEEENPQAELQAWLLRLAPRAFLEEVLQRLDHRKEEKTREMSGLQGELHQLQQAANFDPRMEAAIQQLSLLEFETETLARLEGPLVAAVADMASLDNTPGMSSEEKESAMHHLYEVVVHHVEEVAVSGGRQQQQQEALAAGTFLHWFREMVAKRAHHRTETERDLHSHALPDQEDPLQDLIQLSPTVSGQPVTDPFAHCTNSNIKLGDNGSLSVADQPEPIQDELSIMLEKLSTLTAKYPDEQSGQNCEPDSSGVDLPMPPQISSGTNCSTMKQTSSDIINLSDGPTSSIKKD